MATAKKDEKKDDEAGTDVAVVDEKSKDVAEVDEEAAMMAEMKAESAAAKAELDFSSDVQLPGLILVQATSGYVNEGIAKPGDILHNQTQEGYDALDIVVARVYKTRVLFPGELGEPPLCTSPNAEDGYGDPGDQLPKKGPRGGGACATCPQANWREGGKCQLRYNYMAVLLGPPDEHFEDWQVQLPVGLQMKGTSAKIATRLNSVLIAQDYFWSSVITLKSVPMENDKGKYRGWSFSKSRETTMEEKLHTFRLAKMLRENAEKVTVVGQDESTDAGGEAPDGDIPF